VATALVAGVLAAGAAVATVLTTRDAPTGDGAPTTSTSAPRERSTTTTSSPQVTPIGTYPVATTALTVTVPGLPATDGQLPTTVWYPEAGASRHRPRHGFPLLVFSQGYAQPVLDYSALLTDWASAGFVVAGPTYPHTAPGTPTTLDRSPAELGHHPADLRAVIATLIEAGRAPGSALSGRIDASEVGVVGQSDGGDVSVAVADDTCCRYPAVKAVVSLSGAEYAYFGGRYFTAAGPPGPPILVVQGDDDTVNPPVCSVQLYDAAGFPKYYLDLLGATHLAPYEEATGWETVVAAVTTDFLEAELAGEHAALSRMAASADVAGVASLTTGGAAPPASGTCPTAPGSPEPGSTATAG